MKWFYRLCWFLAYIPFRLLWPTRMYDKNKLIKKGKCILICNHYSNSDPMILGSHVFRQCHFVIKKELTKKPFARMIMKSLQTVPIDRENVGIQSIKHALRYLNKGEMLTMFPEGTRNKVSESMGELKNGVAMFALKGEAPVAPVVFYKRPRVFKKNYMMVGDPIHFDGLKKVSKENIDIVGEKISCAMVDLKAKLDEKIANKKHSKAKI